MESERMAVTFVLLIVAAVTLYLYLTRNYKYWQKRGIPCPDGIVPGIRHFWDFFTTKKTFSECCRKIYNDNQGRSMVGIYNFSVPMLMVRDPELVKTVLQTKFTSFQQNLYTINSELDPIVAHNPFFNYGDKWMIGRKRLTYAFSNMRLKILFETVKQVCEKFEDFLNRKLSKIGKIEVELKELFARFTAQIVSTVGFGVDGHSFNEEKEHESFYTIGNYFLKPSILNGLVFTTTLFIPALGKIFRTRFLPKKADRFFRSVVADVMEQRRIDTTPRNDFLQLMADLERTEGEKFDLELLTSHAVSFFIDGYDTSSSTLSFVAFQLASHLEVQERLRKEIVSVLEKYNNVITYDALKEMTYMDQVISESQRLTPTGGLSIKVCTEECELRGFDGLVCRVQPGTQIVIPVYGLQEDPQYWKNPQMYDPDRFSPENKRSIDKFTFLPFSEGPRMCVGMKMAQLQMKACLATLLRKYSLEVSPKTRVPVKILTYSSFLNYAEGGLWAYIRPLKT